MNAMLHLALLLEEGYSIPKNAHEVEHMHDSIYFTDEYDAYIPLSTIRFDNEQVGYDEYTYEFTNTEFTVDEFYEWLETHNDAIAEYNRDRQYAIQILASITAGIKNQVKDAVDVARKYHIPFTLEIDGVEFDTRKLKYVDWDSSSMYC